MGQVADSVTLGTAVPQSSCSMSLCLFAVLPGPVEEPGAALFAGDAGLWLPPFLFWWLLR